MAATAAFASPRPIDAARSPAVLPVGSVRAEPSGRVTVERSGKFVPLGKMF